MTQWFSGRRPARFYPQDGDRRSVRTICYASAFAMEIASFSNGKWHKNVQTVGDMVDELARLPRDLPVKQGFSPSADLVVFNLDSSDRHLEVDEGGHWDEDADIESQEL